MPPPIYSESERSVSNVALSGTMRTERFAAFSLRAICEYILCVFPVHARAEDAAQSVELREKFDIALTRAVANIGTIAEWTLPFLKNGGYSLMYKGPGAAEELKAAESALR